jgi:hypothetical protein
MVGSPHRRPGRFNEQGSAMDNDHKLASGHGSDAKTKPCLICKSPFPSEWAGERICRKCKSTTAWRSGVVKSY